MTPPSGFDAVEANPDGSGVIGAGAEQNATSDVLVMGLDQQTGDVDVLFDESYDSASAWDEASLDVAVSPGGGRFFLAGYSRSAFPYDYQGLVLAFDAHTGTLLWDEEFGTAGETLDNAYGVAVSPNGARVFVTGTVGTLASTKFATIAYRAATGERIWTKLFKGPDPGGNTASDIDVSPDGTRVFVTGESFDGTALGFATVAYAASDGARLWARRLGRPGVGAAVVALDTTVAVTGTISADPGGNNYDFATAVYASATGNLLWTKRFDGPNDGSDGAGALAVSPNGRRLFVTGGSESSYLTLSYLMADGTRVWARRFGAGAANDVDVDPNGSAVFVTGYDGTVAYDRVSGTKLWAKAAGANELDVASDGSAVFVGGGAVTTAGITAYEA